MAEIPTPGKPNEKDRDPVDVIIIVAGIIVGGLILFGFITMLIPIVTYTSQKNTSNTISLTTDTYSYTEGSTTAMTCPTCFSISQNNQTESLAPNTHFTLELPEALYTRASLLLFGNPDGTISLLTDEKSDTQDFWKVSFTTNSSGAADIVVPSSATTSSDFHLSIIVH